MSDSIRESPPPLDDQSEASESDLPVADDTGAALSLKRCRTSDASLSFEEARVFSGRYGGRLVVLVGEAEAGKTTLWVELWTEMMSAGHLGMIEFAGSATALALEERSYESRLEAGLGQGETVRTRRENNGLLHLRVRTADAATLELFLSDYAGEHFRRIREGTPVRDELPWMYRADRVAVVVDGIAYSEPSSREFTINNVTRQLHALRESSLVAASARVAVVLTKLDRVTGEALEAYEAVEADLGELARLIDESAVCFRVAARPEGKSTTVGLDDLLEWMCSTDRSAATVSLTVPAPKRAMERFRP